MLIRAVRPDDKERILRAFHALDRQSVYLRFFCYRKELAKEELRRVTECDGASEAVLVATEGSGDQQTIVALAGYVRSGAAADIAFAVADDFRGRGIASRLLQQLVDIARANGIRRFEADVLPENTPMLAVFRNSGLRMRTSHEQGVVHATLFIPHQSRALQGLMKLARIAVKMLRAMAAAADDDYEMYVRRRRADHPNLPVMTQEEFAERQAASDVARPYTKV